MADKKLTFNIGAKDDASKVFEALARNAKVDMAAVDAAVDKTASSGKQVAQALGATFDQISADIKGTREAADRLGDALGPELSSRTDLSGAVQEFKRLGLTVDDIKADVDSLAAVIRQADDLTTSSVVGQLDKVGDAAKMARDDLEAMGKADVTPVTGGLDQVNKKLGDDVPRSAGSANSALANMYGNSAQSLGGLIGITGDLGMGIGQLGEYAADATLDGERLGSALGSMAKVAGPMVLLGLAVKAVADVQSRFADSAERTTKDVAAWTDAIDSGGDAAANYAAKLKEAGQIMVDVTRAQSTLTNVVAEADSHWYTTGVGVHLLAEALGATGDEVKDITPLLASAGITAQQFAEAAADPHPAQMQAALAEALKKTTLSADDQKLILLGVTQSQEDYATASANAKFTQQVFGTAVEETTEKVRESAAVRKSAAEIEDDYRQGVQDTVDALNDEADALNEQVDAMQSSADATIAASEAQQGFIDAVGKSNEVQADAEATSEDKRDAVEGERDAMIDAANAQRALTEKNAEAAGKTASATEKVDSFNKSLLDNAHFATPAARDAIADYIIKANGVPAEKATAIKAAIAAGDFATAERLLNEASRARTAAITADADTAQANRELDNAARTRNAIIRVTTSGGAPTSGITGNLAVTARASGGPVKKGVPYLVGEDGPEPFVPDQDGTIIPTGAPTGGGTPLAGAGGATTYNVTINAGIGANGADLGKMFVEAVKRYERSNGTGWRAA